MFILKKRVIFFLIAVSLLGFYKNFAYAEESSIQECRDNGKSVQECPEFLKSKLNLLQGQSKTLASQIAIMDNQISLTQARIEANKREILDLTLDIDTAAKKILSLQASLEKIADALLKRIVATYEAGSVQPLEILLSARDASNLLTRFNYFRIVQKHDKTLLRDVQQAKSDYTNQKEILEAKKKKVESLKNQLETYTLQLANEKQSKQALLNVTRNDEERYQDLLAQARSEYEAIQGIIAGKGQEIEVGNVSEGQIIASVIDGSSCNSGGTHLHFIVSRDGNTENPFNYLKSVDYENCSGPSCGSSDGDSFNPTGSWSWPLDPKIKLTQGYGSTWATRWSWVGRIYSFHNGIDIDGSSSSVKAVKGGALYQGSYTGYNGCRLRYVKVNHEDLGLDTFYLHVNYTF